MGATSDRLFVADIARLAGLSEATVQVYHNTAQAARGRATEFTALVAAGGPLPDNPGRLPKPGDMPVPDGHDYPPGRRPSGERAAGPQAGDHRAQSGARSPYWHPETIGPWLAQRRRRKRAATPAA